MYYVSIKYNYLIHTLVDFVSRLVFRFGFCGSCPNIIMLIALLSDPTRRTVLIYDINGSIQFGNALWKVICRQIIVIARNVGQVNVGRTFLLTSDTLEFGKASADIAVRSSYCDVTCGTLIFGHSASAIHLLTYSSI